MNYEVSSHGRVRNAKTGRIMKQQKAGGYLFICFCTDSNKKTLVVHRLVAGAFILNPENKPFVDHMDRNKLNNSVENLRWATSSENLRNKKDSGRNTSGFKGVSFHKRNGKYKATIQVKHIGYFDNKEDAARAYDKKAKELFGEFATLNFED